MVVPSVKNRETACYYEITNRHYYFRSSDAIMTSLRGLMRCSTHELHSSAISQPVPL